MNLVHPTPSLPSVLDDEPLYPDDPRLLPAGCHVDGAAVRRPLSDEADFVVIGSGAGGATAALTLAEAGFTVAVLEEGPWVRTRELGRDLYPATRRLFRSMGTAVSGGRAFMPLMQGSCVGGSTTINSAIAWRTPEAVLADWSTRFGLGDAISMAALEPHFEYLERELNVHAVEDDALGGNNAMFGEAAARLGFEAHRIRRYDGGCAGSAGCLTGCRTGRKLGMNITFIPRALTAGARLYSQARVERIEGRGGRAMEVVATMPGEHGTGVPLRVRARRGVLVAASTVQTPNLLRRSGLRARALGRHFQVHPGVSMAGMFDRPVRMDVGAAQGFNSLAFLESDGIKLESLALPPELATARLPGLGPELMQRIARYDQMALWAVVVRAEAEGEVGTAFGGGDKVRFTPTRRDMERARKGLKILTEMLFAIGAREVYPGVHGMPAVLSSPDEVARWDDASVDPRAYNMMTSHMFGAARMGPTAATGVVGPDFQSHELAGLYVVDSSVFPTNLGVNPQHTIMAMARLAASRLAARPLPAL
jgi:choline dehydrogenase-like flavoprotein